MIEEMLEDAERIPEAISVRSSDMVLYLAILLNLLGISVSEDR